MRTHLHRSNETESPTYRTWRAMKRRCSDPTDDSFHRYGAVGVRVCPEWVASFEKFLADVGERPSKGHTLDRIENSKGYEPGNVRWATQAEQQRNRSDNLHLTFQGRTQVAKDWARERGLNPTTLYMRLRAGWTIERALSEPQRAWVRRSGSPSHLGPER